MDDSAKAALEAHRWNGNIRELQNCIEKAVILSEKETLGAKDLAIPSSPTQSLMNSTFHSERSEESSPDEETLVKQAMQRCAGNISAAAKLLGVSRPTLYSKLKKYGL